VRVFWNNSNIFIATDKQKVIKERVKEKLKKEVSSLYAK